MKNQDVFVGVYDPVDIRRNLLESSKEVIKSIQSFENLTKKREGKVKVYKEMKSVMSELDLIMTRLTKRLPKSHLRKAISKDSSKPLISTYVGFVKELEELGEELQKVEAELLSLKKF